MDSRAYLGLESTHNPYRWYLPVAPRVTTGGGFLFGGAALGASILALELTTKREVIWATAQYIDYARPGEVLDIDVVVSVSGHNTSQARVIGRVGEREIVTVNAALGSRDIEEAGVWATMPDVPPPLECPLRSTPWAATEDTFHYYLEERYAKARTYDQLDGTHGDGRTLMWARIPSMLEDTDAATLAYLGDFVPMGIAQALGRIGGGNSLDNTLRVYSLVPTEWVLLDVHAHAVARGFGHGLVHMWAEDGTLLATASQSCIVRFWKGDNT